MMSFPHQLKYYLCIFNILCLLKSINAGGGALKLDKSNFDTIIGNTELVFINFYADWCRFSNLLAPTWDETADKVRSLHPDEANVVIAKVDCDSESDVAARFHITKYPTLKLLRNGLAAKREYRGQRSADALSNYISDQLRDPITQINNLNELKDVEEKKRSVIGYYETDSGPQYENFKKVSRILKDDCQFYMGVGDAVRSMHPPGQNIVAFKSTVLKEDEVFRGNLDTYDELSIWATERCIPIVREITFQNAEELTEEGLPFLIMFHTEEDKESVQKYSRVIQNELMDQKQAINFLTADGQQFAHPLHHLGKSKKDLPLIAIDSFRHMYLFKDIKEMETPGKLKQFLLDLSSGKLHREFHYGPDPVKDQDNQIEDKSNPNEKSPSPKPKKPTTPPESTFAKLAPSKNRYTLLDDKDEL